MFCRKCGLKIPDDSEFCFKCGTSVINEPKQKDSELWTYNECIKKMDTAKSMEDFNEIEKSLESLGDFKYSKELIEKCRENRFSLIYNECIKKMDTSKSMEDFNELEKSLEFLGDFKDSKELIEKCRENKIFLIYDYAVALMNSAQSHKDFEEAAENFKYTNGFKDSEKLIEQCEYNRKLWIYNDGYRKLSAAKNIDEFNAAKVLFSIVSDFENSKELEMECQNRINHLIYCDAISQMKRAKTPEEFKAAEIIFQELSGYEDADEQAKKCAEKCAYAAKNELLSKYRRALTSLECSNDISHLNETKRLFLSFGDFSNSSHLAKECERKIDCIKNNKPFVLVNDQEINKEENPVIVLAKDPEIQSEKSEDDVLRCSNCNHIIYSWNSRCPYCGQSVSEEPEISAADGSFEKEKPVIVLDKDPEIQSEKSEDDVLRCSNCNHIIYSWNSRCPYCGQSVSEEPEISAADGSFEKENPVIVLAKDPEIQPEKSKNGVQKCSNCNHPIYSWNSVCPFCGRSVSEKSENSAADDSFEEEYHNLKKSTRIICYVVMGAVSIIFL